MIRFLTPSYTKVKRAREGTMRKKVSVHHWCLSSFFPLLKAAVAFLRAFLTSLFYLNLAPKDRLRAGKSFAEEEDDKDHLQESLSGRNRS